MMDDIMDSCEDLPSQIPDDIRRFRSTNDNYHQTPLHLDKELLALRSQNQHLHSQVQNLTRQLQSCSLHAPQVFYLFPRLPPELRRKIWRHALASPRIMSIDFVQRPHQSVPQFAANYPPPMLLQVCHESREVALETYEWVFGAQSPAGTTPMVIDDEGVAVKEEEEEEEEEEEQAGGFYFDFGADTLCFTRETMPLRIVLFLEDMDPAEVRRVRYLAVGTELPKDAMKYITQFPGLEVFRLILSDPRAVVPRGRFGLVKADHRSIWVMGAYWNHELTSWGRMEALIREAFEEARLMSGDCRVPRVEFVYAVSTAEGCCGDCPGHV